MSSTEHTSVGAATASRGPRPKAKSLTDKQIAAAKPAAEPYRLSDGHGLFLMVMPGGAKVWRCIYAIGGKRSLHKLGEYPAMTLLQARRARLEARLAVQQGHDPNAEKHAAIQQRRERLTETFDKIALERHAYMAAHHWSPHYAKAVRQRLETHVLPAIGKVPFRMVSRYHIIELLERCLAKSGAWQTDHVRQHLVLIFDDLIERGLVEHNPAASLSRKFPTPHKEPQPAVLSIEEARQVLATFENSSAGIMLKLLHRFQALTGLRPSEVRNASWQEFTTAGQWVIPAERMKGRRGRKRSHTVFLSPKAQEILDVARAMAPLNAIWVFPTDRFGKNRHQPFDRSSLVSYMTRLLGKRVHVAHGWRASFATILNQNFPSDRQVIDAMLAHQRRGAVEQRYNRTTEVSFRARAFALWCEWADLLLEGAPTAWALAGLEAPERGNVVQIGRAA